MANIIKVAVTGGPCSGKTTAINRIIKHYKNKGYAVFSLEESARLLIEAGADRTNMLEFEERVLKHQLDAEEKLDEEISKKDFGAEEPVLVIYDRGIVDAFGYLCREDREKLINTVGIDLIQAWCRYDAVMFLENSGLYQNDSSRVETEEEAQQISDSLLSVWMGHPHLRYIKATENIEDKLDSIKREFKHLIKSIEHEKKYLIDYPNFKELEKYKPFKAEIEQIYLLSNVGSHRIRKRGQNGSFAYFETLKMRINGEKCYEYEGVISSEKYEELKKSADPSKHPIVKDRYCFLYKGQYFELDVYPFWNDKAVIELELSSKRQQVELPPEIKLIEDVSKNKKYKNSYLARNI